MCNFGKHSAVGVNVHRRNSESILVARRELSKLFLAYAANDLDVHASIWITANDKARKRKFKRQKHKRKFHRSNDGFSDLVVSLNASVIADFRHFHLARGEAFGW